MKELGLWVGQGGYRNHAGSLDMRHRSDGSVSAIGDIVVAGRETVETT